MHLHVMYYLEATRPVEARLNFYCHHAVMHCALIVMNTHLDLAVIHLPLIIIINLDRIALS